MGRLPIVFAALLLATPALAHTGEGTGGFLAGLAHPVFGPDHVVAMIAVGLWGAFLERDEFKFEHILNS